MKRRLMIPAVLCVAVVGGSTELFVGCSSSSDSRRSVDAGVDGNHVVRGDAIADSAPPDALDLDASPIDALPIDAPPIDAPPDSPA
jgi:hypothetical protein